MNEISKMLEDKYTIIHTPHQWHQQSCPQQAVPDARTTNQSFYTAHKNL